MELHERIAFVRKAAGLTQEQLGEKLGVTRQAVSKWESNQATPDALTIARLCAELQVSADFVLLGKEPEGTPASTPPVAITCPCCGKPAAQGTPKCHQCGYDYYPNPADDERRYAIIVTGVSYGEDLHLPLVQYGGHSEEEARQLIHDMQNFGENHLEKLLLRRDLPRSAALWIAASLREHFGLRLVADAPLPGRADSFLTDDQLLEAPQALDLPEARKQEGGGGLGFWGVVGAVVVGLLIASFL